MGVWFVAVRVKAVQEEALRGGSGPCGGQKFALFSSPDPLFVLFFQFPTSFVDCEDIFNDENAQRPPQFNEIDRHLIMSSAHVYNKCPFSV